MEQDPMGGGMAPPGGTAAPPGGDPMAGGMDPMGGAPPAGAPEGADPVPVPIHGDVWDVLDAILNDKTIEEPAPPQAPVTGVDPMAGGMGMGMDPMMGGMDPMGGMGGAPPMGGDPMAGGAPPMGGGGGPFLQG